MEGVDDTPWERGSAGFSALGMYLVWMTQQVGARTVCRCLKVSFVGLLRLLPFDQAWMMPWLSLKTRKCMLDEHFKANSFGPTDVMLPIVPAWMEGPCSPVAAERDANAI